MPEPVARLGALDNHGGKGDIEVAVGPILVHAGYGE
jgi:hypothetical protein